MKSIITYSLWDENGRDVTNGVAGDAVTSGVQDEFMVISVNSHITVKHNHTFAYLAMTSYWNEEVTARTITVDVSQTDIDDENHNKHLYK